jgi:hypothetical protein
MQDSDWTGPTPQPPESAGWPGPEQPRAAAAPARGRSRRPLVAIGAAVAVAIAAVAIALVTSSRPAAATPAQELAAATHASAALNSESAAVTEQLGSMGNFRGTFSWQRSPFIDVMSVTEDVAGAHVPLSVIVTKRAMFVQVGKMSGLPGLPAGKWIKIPLAGGGDSSVPMLAVMDPLAELKMLAAGHRVRAVGAATVGGVATTRYTGVISVAAGLKSLPASSQSRLGSVLKGMSGDIQFTVWIDGSHRVRKFTENVPAKPVTVRVSMTFYGLNRPLTVKVPSASQLARLPGGDLGLP